MKEYSTEDADNMKFRAHGRISFRVEDGNIIHYRGIGPFNFELIKALEAVEKDVLELVRKDTRNWVEIIEFEGSCMAVNSFIEELGIYLKNLSRDNLSSVATAFIIADDVEGATIMKDSYRKCYRDAGLSFQIFTNYDDARNWAVQSL